MAAMRRRRGRESVHRKLVFFVGRDGLDARVHAVEDFVKGRQLLQVAFVVAREKVVDGDGGVGAVEDETPAWIFLGKIAICLMCAVFAAISPGAYGRGRAARGHVGGGRPARTERRRRSLHRAAGEARQDQ